mmetsp:Transcript_42342/g.121625  ORF Transcript_42342/g.121625 Transcript_42342/m.121625 type:complete len:285 (-) Transcript_42342:285-1139(-)
MAPHEGADRSVHARGGAEGDRPHAPGLQSAEAHHVRLSASKAVPAQRRPETPHLVLGEQGQGQVRGAAGGGDGDPPGADHEGVLALPPAHAGAPLLLAGDRTEGVEDPGPDLQGRVRVRPLGDRPQGLLLPLQVPSHLEGGAAGTLEAVQEGDREEQLRHHAHEAARGEGEGTRRPGGLHRDRGAHAGAAGSEADQAPGEAPGPEPAGGPAGPARRGRDGGRLLPPHGPGARVRQRLRPGRGRAGRGDGGPTHARAGRPDDAGAPAGAVLPGGAVAPAAPGCQG